MFFTVEIHTDDGDFFYQYEDSFSEALTDVFLAKAYATRVEIRNGLNGDLIYKK